MPPDRRRDLEDELRDLGPRVEYPPTPDLAGRIRSRLAAERSGGDERDRRRVPAWAGWVVAAALVLLVAVPVLSLAVRGGLGGGAAGVASGGGAGSGGQGGVEVSPGDQAAGSGPEAGNERTMSSTQGAEAGSAAAGAASVAPGEAATGYPAQEDSGPEAGSADGFISGERITLREARTRSEGPILLPRSQGFGKPDKVYTSGFGPGFVLLYRAGSGLPGIRAAGVGETDIGLLLTQTRGDIGEVYLTSGTTRGQDLETVSVNGGRGYWVPPGQRFLKVARDLSPSTAVLLWERDGQALRIETGASKEEAVRIAESVR